MGRTSWSAFFDLDESTLLRPHRLFEQTPPQLAFAVDIKAAVAPLDRIERGIQIACFNPQKWPQYRFP